MKIHEKLSAIQQKIKVHKGQYNSFGKYNYRSAEDILEALKPLEKEYNVAFISSEKLESFGSNGSADHKNNSVESYTQNLAVICEAFIIDCETTDSISAKGTALIDFDAKGMQMPQRTGAASSYAKKYAYGNLLLLDDTKDSDASNDHGKGSKSDSKPSSTPKSNGKPLMTKAQFDAAVKAYNDGDESAKKAVRERVNSKYKLTEEQVKQFFNESK